MALRHLDTGARPLPMPQVLRRPVLMALPRRGDRPLDPRWVHTLIPMPLRLPITEGVPHPMGMGPCLHLMELHLDMVGLLQCSRRHLPLALRPHSHPHRRQLPRPLLGPLHLPLLLHRLQPRWSLSTSGS